MPDKKKLWRLYGEVRAAQRKGVGYQEINDNIRSASGGTIAGVASLEKELGIGDPKGRGEKLGESVANIGDKVLMGYGGEAVGAAKGIGAKMTGGSFQDAYQAGQAQADATIEGAAETSPLAAGIGTAAGYALPGVLAGATMPASAGVTAARAAAPLRAQMLGQGARGAAMGALGGAAEGASDPGTRMEGMGKGAMWGAAGAGLLGSLMPALGAGIGAAASKVSGALPAAERKATGLLGRALERSGVKPHRLPEQMGSMPKGSVVGDIDASLRREGRAAVNVAPELDDVGQPLDELRRRHAGRGERVARGLRREADLPSGYDPDEVFKMQRSQWLEEHVNPLSGRRVRMADEVIDLDNKQLRKAFKDADIDIDNLPDDVDFDQLWAARQEANHLKRSPDINQFKRDKAAAAQEYIDGVLERKVPGAQAMFGEYRRIKAVEELYDVGRKLGTGDEVMALDRAIEAVGDDPQKRQALQQGLVSWFEGKLRRKGPGGSVARDLMDLPPRTRDQLRTLFGEDKIDDMARFVQDELQGRELRWDKLMTTLTGNSTTAQQAEDMRKLMGPTRAPQLRDLWNRIYTAGMTNVDFSRDVAYEYGRILLGDLDDAAIRRITDTMIDLSESQTMQTFRGTIPTGAASSRYGEGLVEKLQGPQQEEENPLGFTNF